MESAAVKILGRSVIACAVILGVLAGGGGALVGSPVGEPQGFISGIVKDPAGVPVPSVWIAREDFIAEIRKGPTGLDYGLGRSRTRSLAPAGTVTGSESNTSPWLKAALTV